MPNVLMTGFIKWICLWGTNDRRRILEFLSQIQGTINYPLQVARVSEDRFELKYDFKTFEKH